MPLSTLHQRLPLSFRDVLTDQHLVSRSHWEWARSKMYRKSGAKMVTAYRVILTGLESRLATGAGIETVSDHMKQRVLD